MINTQAQMGSALFCRSPNRFGEHFFSESGATNVIADIEILNIETYFTTPTRKRIEVYTQPNWLTVPFCKKWSLKEKEKGVNGAMFVASSYAVTPILCCSSLFARLSTCPPALSIMKTNASFAFEKKWLWQYSCVHCRRITDLSLLCQWFFLSSVVRVLVLLVSIWKSL